MKTICIDIDGTICEYRGWHGANVFGKVLPGASETIQCLKEHGWFVIIFTTRANKAAISKFLAENGIPFDAINENPFQPQNAIGGKPLADIYLDDRAITFRGNWNDALDEILHFKSWENK